MPKVVLKHFQGCDKEDAPVIVFTKKDNTFRPRGIGHGTFTASSNYYGDGSVVGTLEHQLGQMDESSINEVIQIIKSGIAYAGPKEDFHCLLWNHTVRSPQFRKHPKVGDSQKFTPEEFHLAAMDSFPEQDLSDYEIVPLHIEGNTKRFILPDFNLKYFVLTPNVILIRSMPDEVSKMKMYAENYPNEFVQFINDESMESAVNWLVSSSESEFEHYGATRYLKL